MSDSMVIQCSKWGSSFEFYDPVRRSAEGIPEGFSVRFKSRGIDASTEVDAMINGAVLPKFFRDLADNWKGWKGAKTWETLELGLKLSSTMDRTGHVALEVSFHPMCPGPWRVNGVLHFEAGALEALAQEAERFFRV